MGADHIEVPAKALLERLFRPSHVWMHFPRGVCVRERQKQQDRETEESLSYNLSQTWQRDSDLTPIKFLQVLGNLRNKFCLLMLSLCCTSVSERRKRANEI